MRRWTPHLPVAGRGQEVFMIIPGRRASSGGSSAGSSRGRPHPTGTGGCGSAAGKRDHPINPVFRILKAIVMGAILFFVSLQIGIVHLSEKIIFDDIESGFFHRDPHLQQIQEYPHRTGRGINLRPDYFYTAYRSAVKLTTQPFLYRILVSGKLCPSLLYATQRGLSTAAFTFPRKLIIMIRKPNRKG